MAGVSYSSHPLEQHRHTMRTALSHMNDVVAGSTHAIMLFSVFVASTSCLCLLLMFSTMPARVDLGGEQVYAAKRIGVLFAAPTSCSADQL